MKNKKELIDIYNKVNDEKIDLNKFQTIASKLLMILKKTNLDDIETIDLMDVLFYFAKNNELNKINEESINLVLKITKRNKLNLENTLYLSLMLKNILLPASLNKCQYEHEILLYLSEFELLLELIRRVLDKKDLEVLSKYNYSLFTVILEYHKCMQMYQSKMQNEVFLSTFISHISSIYYFNQENYDDNPLIIEEIVDKLINNYHDFINYCYNEGIYDNFSKIYLNKEELTKEYGVSKKIIDSYIKKEKEQKRK